MACRAAGADDTEARLGLGRAQRRQREFLAAHPELQRRPGREQVYGSDGSTAKVAPLSRRPVTKHAEERMTERGVTREQVENAISEPLHKKPIKVDDQGRRSQTIVGRDATVVVNPETGKIITTYRTGKRERRRYGADQGAD